MYMPQGVNNFCDVMHHIFVIHVKGLSLQQISMFHFILEVAYLYIL